MKHNIHIILFQNIFYLIIKENRKYSVIIISLQCSINWYREVPGEESNTGVKCLTNRKAYGADKISNYFIKSTFEKMKEIYVDLYNRILKEF